MKNPKFQIYKDRAGEFRFRLLAKNGENILHASEGYRSKQGAQTGIASVRINAELDQRYQREEAKNEQFYFALKAANGEIIGMSETYATKAGRETGIASVKKNAPAAPTEDLSSIEQ